jgi:hypothetical protein
VRKGIGTRFADIGDHNKTEILANLDLVDRAVTLMRRALARDEPPRPARRGPVEVARRLSPSAS